MSFFLNILNLFINKEKRFYNSIAKDIMIDASKFNHSKLTLGNIFKVNENVMIKNFKNKIEKDNLTVVVIDTKGKTLGYITRREIQFK